MLNDIAQDVKQLQNMATSAGRLSNTPEQAETPLQGVPTPTSHYPLQPLKGHDHKIHRVGSYPGDSGFMPNPASQVATISRQSERTDRKSPREHQRRRLHPPIHSDTSTPQEHEMESESAIDDTNSEIVQMAGQLSLDENRTVRYHGDSSGLNLLTRSKRFDGTFWNLPNPGNSQISFLNMRVLAGFRSPNGQNRA